MFRLLRKNAQEKIDPGGRKIKAGRYMYVYFSGTENDSTIA